MRPATNTVSARIV